MTRENAKKLQSMMAKEAVTLLMLGGAEADRAEHEEAIRLIGEAWGLAEEETARQIERIGHGRQSVRMGAENMPPDEGDVSLALTGREVIELERDLFETAVHRKRAAIGEHRVKRWRRQRRGVSRAAVLWLPERKMHGRICELSTGIRRAGRGTGTVWRHTG